MKHECNVARDLMPLVLDGAASGESLKLLDEHLAECAACKEYFGGMKAALPVALKANNEQEQKNFGEAARKLRKKRRRRLWLKILVGILIGVIVTCGASWGWTRLTNDLTMPIVHNYNVFLSQLSDGKIAFSMDYYGSSRVMGVRLEEKQENGKQVVYVYNETSRIPQYMQTPNQNYSFTRMDSLDDLDEIRQGVPGNYAVVWKAGESISPASEEMEKYFTLLDQVLDIYMFDENGRMRTTTYEENQQMKNYQEQLHALEDAVPEWQ